MSRAARSRFLPSYLRRLVVGAACSLLVAPLWAIDELDYLGSYDSGSGEGAAEIVAYDAGSQRIFVLNGNDDSVEIVDLKNPANPVLVSTIDLTAFGVGANSVAVSGGVVAIAVEADPAQDPGRIAFFDIDGNALGDADVGALPDMVTFTPDGTRVLVANEGEPSDDYSVDPEGSVSIVSVPVGGAEITVETLGFTDWNAGGSRAGELPDDVRIFGPNATVAQDLEPEYITVSSDGTMAWVSLQENNALGVIDIASAAVTRIDALGFKDHSLDGNGFDGSDRDDSINIQTWPTLGMYQPDAIANFSVSGTPYVVTANEGDSRDYDGLSEEERVDDLVLDATAYPDAATLQSDENLGRLKTTNTLGDIDDDGDVDQIYSYGARSFSIWNGVTGALVWDSGDDFEQKIAAQVPAIFNSQGDADSFDSRSDDKGPEPEAVAMGRLGGRDFAFIGLERVDGIMVYDVSAPAAPEFVLYQPAEAVDDSPESVVFVSPEDSPNGRALVLASNEDSGTVSVYQVLIGGDTGEGGCMPGATTLCLRDQRFEVQVEYDAGDLTGPASAEGLTEETGVFTFFGEENVELILKVLNGCDSEFDAYWVFVAGLTNVAVDITVTDTQANEEWTYSNPAGTPFPPVQDTGAFATCP